MSSIERTILTGNAFQLKVNHIRILKVLSRARGPITRQTIAERIQGTEDVTFTDGRVPNESETYNDLTSLSYVRFEELDSDGMKFRTYTILAKGREALAAAK